MWINVFVRFVNAVMPRFRRAKTCPRHNDCLEAILETSLSREVVFKKDFRKQHLVIIYSRIEFHSNHFNPNTKSSFLSEFSQLSLQALQR